MRRRAESPSPAAAAAAAALLLAAALAASGCRSAPATLPPGSLVLPVPPAVQERPHECGLASVAALCAYHGRPLPDAEHRALEALAAERDGLSGDELRAALRRAGYEAYVFAGELGGDGPTSLRGHLDRGRPVLVALAPGDDHHFALVHGHAPPDGPVLLHDPVRGAVVLPPERFRALWEPAGRFSLLAVPADPGGP